jgi:hypothetical protein
MMDGHPKITKGSLDTDNAHKKLNRKKKKITAKVMSEQWMANNRVHQNQPSFGIAMCSYSYSVQRVVET